MSSNRAANFSPDGSRYALGGFDGRLRVVDVATGDVHGPSDPVHNGPIAWVAFSPDGETLASLGFDGVLTLSEAATAAPRAQSRPGPPNVHGGIGFVPDGDELVLGYRDGRVIVLTTDPAAWVAHACAVAGRDLTADEWRDAFGDSRPQSTCGELARPS